MLCLRVFRTTLRALQINYLTPSWHIELVVERISLRLSGLLKLSWNVISAPKGEYFPFYTLTTPHRYILYRSPVIIFLSDGECAVSDQTVQDLCRSAVHLGLVSQILLGAVHIITMEQETPLASRRIFWS